MVWILLNNWTMQQHTKPYPLGGLAMAVQGVESLGDGVFPMSASGVMARLFVIGALIILNAFFVAAEFSIVSVRRSRINQLAAVGDVQAQTVQSLQRSIDQLLPTTQIGITLASLALGWIGEDTLALLLHHWLKKLPLPATFLAHAIALTIAFWTLAYLQIVLGETSAQISSTQLFRADIEAPRPS